MEFTAPAKLNLYLEVIQQQDDGYHQIETLFERISIFDRITVEITGDRTTITCDDPRVPTGEDSLLGRTIRIFKEAAARKDLFFQITLEKNIPISAGLGGGSSDAAALLKGLNSISGSPVDDETLLRLSRQLGADVPFFLSDCSFGIGKGRGDIIQKVETSLDIWHVLVSAPFEISTREIYGKIDALGLTKNRGLDRIISTFLTENSVCGLTENLHNDLQTIVLQDFPVLKQVFSELKKAGAEGVLLSGSGSTMFGIFKQDEVNKAAEKVREVFPENKDWRVCVARTY